MRQSTFFPAIALGIIFPAAAMAHASDQSFVLLLPTGIYTIAGVLAVVLTVVALFVLPDSLIRTLFAYRPRTGGQSGRGPMVVSLLSFATLAALVVLGFAGPRDPLSNLMPLGFWTLGWVALVSLCGVFGNFWRWLNPWMGLYQLIAPDWRQRVIPPSLGQWPAVFLLIGFAAFLLADIAPDDPARLAGFVAVYWLVTMAGLLIGGPSWLDHVELGYAICGSYSRLAPIHLGASGKDEGHAGIGGPGWQVVHIPGMPAAGIFAVTLLAVGSFDGLNETFWWLGLIGVNPLEFPGRSAVIFPTLFGLLGSVAFLIAVFATTVWLGTRLGGNDVTFKDAFGRLALCLLPIALVYHTAHYLPSFLVTIQYTLSALSDPLGTGADLLGIEPFRVTTGFFNRLDTVRVIWLTQAGLIVLGHVWSVLLSHRVAIDLFPGRRQAALATLPMSIFMIGYTLFGLWLLAAPKGA